MSSWLHIKINQNRYFEHEFRIYCVNNKHSLRARLGKTVLQAYAKFNLYLLPLHSIAGSMCQRGM